MKWTNEEIETIRQLYGKVTALEIARELDRSAQSVRQKAHRLGLRKRKTYRRYKTVGRIPGVGEAQFDKEEAVLVR